MFKGSISNLFLFLSFVFTGLAFYNQEFYQFGINDNFLNQGIYHIYLLQFFIGTFLHGNIMHILANSIFVYFFGNIVELVVGKKNYILFFLFIVFMNGFILSLTTNVNTIGISGFCMALLTFYTLDLKFKNNPDYKGGITAIILNIAIGLIPGISFMGHFLGFVGGIIFFLFFHNFLRPKYIGEIEKS